MNRADGLSNHFIMLRGLYFPKSDKYYLFKLHYWRLAQVDQLFTIKGL